MLDILLTFLGINSWYLDFFMIKKNKINTNICKGNKNLKSLNLLKLLENETPSPRMERYVISRNEKPSFSKKIFFMCYTFYYIIILLILFIQPIYTLVKYIYNPVNIKLLSSFFIHINIPIIYIWEKYYFKTNHLETKLTCEKFKVLFISCSTALSIILNFLDISSFYNDYYWLSTINNNILFFIFIIIEWVYSRMILFLFVYCFIFVLNNHIIKFKKLIKDIENNEFNFEENTCLSNIISELSKIRHEIEVTITFYNNVLSITTILGGLGMAIFIRDIIPNNIKNLNDINFDPHDRYLIHPVILYLCGQIILIINMSRYAYRRDEILKFIKSINFMNRFLTRMPTEKIMRKSNNNLSMVTLNMIEETATTIDWIILGNMLSEKWLDFTIFGISTSDGKMIKRSITVGSTLLLFISFFQSS